MATPAEIEAARAALVGRAPGVLPHLPTVAPPPTVVPMGAPMGVAQQDAARMMGMGAPPPSLPPTAAQIAAAPEYNPATMGPMLGVVGAAPTPVQQARDALLARTPSGAPAAAPVPAPKPAVPMAEAGVPMSPKPKPSGGGGGARPAAPRGPSLTDIRRADERRIVASYGEEQDTMRRAANAQAVVDDEASRALAAQSRTAEELASDEAAVQRDYEAQRSAFREQTNRMTEALRTREVDPTRAFGTPTAGSAIAIALGGALAGMYGGMTGRGGNDFVDAINRHIERDIAAQQGKIENEKAALGERQTLYGQMIASHKDATLARLQTKNAMLEAAKMKADSEAQRLGTDVARANADRAIGLIGRQQSMLQRDLDAAEEQAAARKAAAAAAARLAAEERAFNRGVKLEELRLKGAEIDAKEGGGKLDGRFVATGQGQGGAPVGYLAATPEAAAKRKEGIDGAQRAMALVDQIIDRRDQQGTLGRALSRTEGGIFGSPEWKVKNSADHQALVLALKDAEKLGAISASDAGMLRNLVGDDPNAVGVFSDDTKTRLSQLRANLAGRLKQEASTEAGTQVAKVVGPDGRTSYVPLGGANAPNNPRTVPRFNADGSAKR